MGTQYHQSETSRGQRDLVAVLIIIGALTAGLSYGYISPSALQYIGIMLCVIVFVIGSVVLVLAYLKAQHQKQGYHDADTADDEP